MTSDDEGIVPRCPACTRPRTARQYGILPRRAGVRRPGSPPAANVVTGHSPCRRFAIDLQSHLGAVAIGGIIAALAATLGGISGFGASLVSAPLLLLLGFPLPL